MWLYSSRYGTDAPIVLYDYQPSRSGACCEAFLGKDFCGYLMVDGYSGYNVLDAAVRCCCLGHFRLYWLEASKTKTGSLDPDDPAVTGFMFSNQIFRMERDIKDMDPEERKKIRLEKERPLWKQFWEWMEPVEASGGSPLYKALTFARNHKDTFENYMLDGNLPVSNVYAELQARSYATARKNFLCHHSANGARSAAILMSLIDSAKANGLNPEGYLVELLGHRKEYVKNPKKRPELAPWSSRMKEACASKK